MLVGKRIGLRARHDDDIPVLQAALYDDVVTHSRAQAEPWRPLTPGSPETHLAVDDSVQRYVPFSVVELTEDGSAGALVGNASLWGIDTHNRLAHIGLALMPAARGKGYASDVVDTLCHYGFVVRGLRRLQIETLADNAAMLGAAERNGFVREGVLRSSAWVLGEILDEVLLGLLAEEWRPLSERA
ncbi:GNAT family N-acetyltransferase [Streptomyces sp. NPDC090025]|uniref:GNAT family N-acetyltransferase n=1 Tax=Streptomyces sp. NPDC090025 TaxID=3365922 RepID=UPI003834ED4E